MSSAHIRGMTPKARGNDPNGRYVFSFRGSPMAAHHEHSGAHERVVIIGSGPAGYTAAIYAARALLKPLLLSGFEPGGQLMITTDVENYPGFPEPVQGPELMERMRAQAEHVGARVESEYVTALELGRRPFRIVCDSGRTLTADAVI